MSPHNQSGFYGPKQVLHFALFKQCALIIIMWVFHFAPLKQCALIIIMWVFQFAPLKQCALIIIMWVLPKFVLVYGFTMPCMYCILGFCSMMNVYRIINYLGARICHTSFNQGKGSKVPFHSCHSYDILGAGMLWNDALPSHGVKPTWGFHKVKLRKVETRRHAPDFQL